MYIYNFEKFKLDISEYDLSLELFNYIYNEQLENVLNIKMTVLRRIFFDSVDFSYKSQIYNKYSNYLFIKIKKYIDNIYNDFEVLLQIEESITTRDIVDDFDYLKNIKSNIDKLMLPENITANISKKNEIIETFFNGLLENINGYKSYFNNKNLVSLFFSSNVLMALEREVHKISTEGSYESYVILLGECVKTLDDEIFSSVLADFENCLKYTSIGVTKIKHNLVNSLNLEKPEVRALACKILDNIKKLESLLDSFLMIEAKEKIVVDNIDFEMFKTLYEQGVANLDRKQFNNTVNSAKNVIQFFLANYKEFYDLNDEQKMLVISVNQSIHLIQNFLNNNVSEDKKNQVAICETLIIKRDILLKELDKIIKNNDDTEYFIEKIYIKEIATIEEVVYLTINDLLKENESFAKNLEMLHFDLVNALKVINIEIFLPNKGDRFNSKLHIVENVVVDEDFAVGEIIRIVYNGYKIDNRVIQPARVIVCTK